MKARPPMIRYRTPWRTSSCRKSSKSWIASTSVVPVLPAGLDGLDVPANRDEGGEPVLGALCLPELEVPGLGVGVARSPVGHHPLASPAAPLGHGCAVVVRCHCRHSSRFAQTGTHDSHSRPQDRGGPAVGT